MLNNAGIDVANTVAPDGGGASYVWIGGNDLATEGNWIWDGDNDGTGPQFWMGDLNGSPVGGLYNNWGMEPDDFGSGQDALGLALTDWPLGVAGEWNDVDDTNTLYYVIEYSTLLSTNDVEIANNISVYPNPTPDFLFITNNGDTKISQIELLSSTGQQIDMLKFRDAGTELQVKHSKLRYGNLFCETRF